MIFEVIFERYHWLTLSDHHTWSIALHSCWTTKDKSHPRICQINSFISFRKLSSIFFFFPFGFESQTGWCRSVIIEKEFDLWFYKYFPMMFSQAAYYFLNLLERSNFDIIYLAWLWSLFKPVCLLLLSLFLLPATILLLIYGSSLFCLIYKHWNRLKVGEFNG